MKPVRGETYLKMRRERDRYKYLYEQAESALEDIRSSTIDVLGMPSDDCYVRRIYDD